MCYMKATEFVVPDGFSNVSFRCKFPERFDPTSAQQIPAFIWIPGYLGQEGVSSSSNPRSSVKNNCTILKATFTPHRVKVIQGDAGVVPWGCRISVRSHKFTIWQTILKATFTPHPRRCRRLVLFSSLEVVVPHFDHTSPYCLANLHSYSKLANEDHERDAQSQGTLPLELNVPAFIGSLDYPHLVSPIAEFRITLAYSDAHSGRARYARRVNGRTKNRIDLAAALSNTSFWGTILSGVLHIGKQDWYQAPLYQEQYDIHWPSHSTWTPPHFFNPSRVFMLLPGFGRSTGVLLHDRTLFISSVMLSCGKITVDITLPLYNALRSCATEARARIKDNKSVKMSIDATTHLNPG
ncbi:uncharacterized protein LACBIDRAFT_328298 [Laccaria bicolor S238N-H82]|uniref:Predicted protein n=1 Tax=Laccaria bicolor (strain S238N-H82 / ATCC MYA-4686) TaxID=486041 RepID=B0DEG3_LACBS|nr:uncharacterized protein LACBIDRAFT_328298 [Laccaria bicolor S238N-H82]EDR07028.1 predicted protein [Laccaria bicolor S238N-H82]|eukprot:XP_001882401.1 predicted protein [Laccaria bicolor S238N-H82]